MSIKPVYVKHSVLGASRYDSQVAFNLCMAANDVVPGHLLGARQIRGLWEIQVKSSIARDRLLVTDCSPMVPLTICPEFNFMTRIHFCQGTFPQKS